MHWTNAFSCTQNIDIDGADVLWRDIATKQLLYLLSYPDSRGRIKKPGLMTFKIIKAVSFQTVFWDVTPTTLVSMYTNHYEVKFTTQLLWVNVRIKLFYA